MGRNDATDSMKRMAFPVSIIALGRFVTMSVVMGQYVQRRLQASVSSRSMPHGGGA